MKYTDGQVIDLSNTQAIQYQKFEIPTNGYLMQPGEFLLGSTSETVKIPDDLMGWIETRGSLARIGIQAHLCDAHIDSGFRGQITLQLKNNANHSVIIYPNFYIVKIYFFQLSSRSEVRYKGRYQNQTGPTVPETPGAK